MVTVVRPVLASLNELASSLNVFVLGLLIIGRFEDKSLGSAAVEISNMKVPDAAGGSVLYVIFAAGLTTGA
jgi:hypothetical protein